MGANRIAYERWFSEGWIRQRDGVATTAYEGDTHRAGREAFKHAEATGRDVRWKARHGERKGKPLDWGHANGSNIGQRREQ